MKVINIEFFQIALETLSQAYIGNPGTSLVTGEDYTGKRLKRLMRYALFHSMAHHEAYISDDLQAVLLCLSSGRRQFSLKMMFLDVWLFLTVVGVFRVKRVLQRERLLRKHHPVNGEYLHLWFLAVKPNNRGQGFAGKLIQEVLALAKSREQTVIVETVELAEYYQRFGFSEYAYLPSAVLPYHFLKYTG